MTTREQLSVVIAAFNAAGTLRDSVESAKTVANTIIVVDDGSTDNTADVARSMGVHLISQVNAGAAFARAVGADHVSTRYLSFLDADDLLVEEGVNCSISSLEDETGLGVCAGQVSVKGATHSTVIPHGFEKVDTAKLVGVGYSPWPPAAAIIRTSAYKAARELPLPELHTRFAEDYEMLIRLSMVSRISSHDEVSCAYQVQGGKSARNTERVVECKERIRSYYGSYNDFRWSPLTTREIRSVIAARTGHAALRNENYCRALVDFMIATVNRPSLISDAVARRMKSLPRSKK